MVFHPSDPNIIYAGGSSTSVIKSINGGATWNPSDTGLATNITSLVMDPSAPATLYAGSLYSGVYKSTDSGGTWTPQNTGLDVLNVQSLAIDPVTPTILPPTATLPRFSPNRESRPIRMPKSAGGTNSLATPGC